MDYVTGQATPEALEAQRKAIIHWHAEAHTFLDNCGIPRWAEEKSAGGHLVTLTLKQRIVKLNSRWANNVGEPDETPNPKL